MFFKTIKIIFILLCFCVFSTEVFSAEDPSGFSEIRGLAIVHIKSKHLHVKNHMGVIVTPDAVQFFLIDDFGGIPLVVDFDKNKLRFRSPDEEKTTKSKNLKKVLSLPLKKQDFLDFLNYNYSKKFIRLWEENQESWQKSRQQKLKMIFTNFKSSLPSQSFFPHTLRIEYKKYFLEIKWQKIEFIK